MSGTAAEDDVVRTHEEAARFERPPLLVLDPLLAFLDDHALGFGPLRARPLGEGHSNVTFLLEREEWRAVLRRPPRPPLAPSTHDVLREARLLRGLVPAGVRAPNVLAACAEEAVIGAPFYVMDLIDGDVVTARVPDGLTGPGEAERMAHELVDALVALHAVDWRDAGLDGFGRPDGYLARQLRRFGDLAERNATRALPDLDAVTDWLRENLPDSSAATVVHGDYRLGNVVYAQGSPARLVGILDWEMATIGDPLADLGYLLATYARPGRPENPMSELSAATMSTGFPEPDDLRRRYEERSGRDTSSLAFYEVLALWKAAIFLEGSYGRHLAGSTDDPFSPVSTWASRPSPWPPENASARATRVGSRLPGQPTRVGIEVLGDDLAFLEGIEHAVLDLGGLRPAGRSPTEHQLGGEATLVRDDVQQLQRHVGKHLPETADHRADSVPPLVDHGRVAVIDHDPILGKVGDGALVVAAVERVE
jgi:aminoglycoside phosphotransferase (APT) family kinase protein